MVIVHWLDLKMIFLKWVFFNLRIWLIFKETHWRDLHHFHSVLIDFMTTSEKKTLDGSLDLEIQNPKLQTTYQANIQYRPIFSMIKLLKGSNFSKSYHFIASLYNHFERIKYGRLAPAPRRTRIKKSRSNSIRVVRRSLTVWL